VETSDPAVLRFMERVFESDFYRFPFRTQQNNLYISPIDSRQKMENAILLSKESIQIFSASLSDPSIINILQEKRMQ